MPWLVSLSGAQKFSEISIVFRKWGGGGGGANGNESLHGRQL